MINKVKGRGSVYQQKGTSNWLVSFLIEDENGINSKYYIKADTKKEAEEKRRAFLRNYEPGYVFSFSSVAEFGKYYLDTVKKNTLVVSTYSVNCRILKNQIAPYLGAVMMKDLTGEMVQEMLNSLSEYSSNHTIKKAHLLTESIVEYYRNLNCINKNIMMSVIRPVSKVKSNKKETEKEYCLTIDQIERICEISTATDKYGSKQYRYGEAIKLLAYSGMRIGELLALEWKDIDFENHKINIKKTVVEEKVAVGENLYTGPFVQDYAKSKKSNRTIKMTPKAFEALEAIKAQNGDQKYVICKEDGGLVRRTTVDHEFKSILAKADVHVEGRCGVHILRHSFSTYLKDHKLNSEAISYYLGHATPEITESVYIHRKQDRSMKNCQNSSFFQ